jgi:thiamine kinase-like enzyme
LAYFHAKFLAQAPKGLWSEGTYWHLSTRPDELEQMNNFSLKHAARKIDDRLKSATFQTLVHGDAKLANFCFSESGTVAAVDFQYVGKGCGMKDVAYFISSCFDEEACEKHEEKLLIHYFKQLEMAIDRSIDYQQLKEEWHELYRYAWADFYRFLDGWSPGHWKMHGYSARMTQQVIDELAI